MAYGTVSLKEIFKISRSQTMESLFVNIVNWDVIHGCGIDLHTKNSILQWNASVCDSHATPFCKNLTPQQNHCRHKFEYRLTTEYSQTLALD